MTSGGEAALFWILAPICVLGALGLLFLRKAVHVALGMAVVMINLGIFYIAQKAEFLGIVQIVVYTGAVMMLFLFVLMLIGVDSSDSLVETIKGQKVAGLLLSVGLGVVLVMAIGSVTFASPVGLQEANANGNVTGIPDLRQVCLGFRGHQRAAHHGSPWCHGAGSPGAAHPAPDPAPMVRAAFPGGQEPGRTASAGCLCAPQRGRHPGAVA
jgi:NADH:ubiquinone oxidoreductase subunit 6 (subunit J)